MKHRKSFSSVLSRQSLNRFPNNGTILQRFVSIGIYLVVLLLSSSSFLSGIVVVVHGEETNDNTNSNNNVPIPTPVPLSSSFVPSTIVMLAPTQVQQQQQQDQQDRQQPSTLNLQPNFGYLPCSVCSIRNNEIMFGLNTIVPGGIVSFLPNDIRCFRLQQLALNSNYNLIQCAQIRLSTIPSLCGCISSNDVINPTPPSPTTSVLVPPSLLSIPTFGQQRSPSLSPLSITIPWLPTNVPSSSSSSFSSSSLSSSTLQPTIVQTRNSSPSYSPTLEQQESKLVLVYGQVIIELKYVPSLILDSNVDLYNQVLTEFYTEKLNQYFITNANVSMNQSLQENSFVPIKNIQAVMTIQGITSISPSSSDTTSATNNSTETRRRRQLLRQTTTATATTTTTTRTTATAATRNQFRVLQDQVENNATTTTAPTATPTFLLDSWINVTGQIDHTSYAEYNNLTNTTTNETSMFFFTNALVLSMNDNEDLFIERLQQPTTSNSSSSSSSFFDTVTSVLAIHPDDFDDPTDDPSPPLDDDNNYNNNDDDGLSNGVIVALVASIGGIIVIVTCYGVLTYSKQNKPPTPYGSKKFATYNNTDYYNNGTPSMDFENTKGTNQYNVMNYNDTTNTGNNNFEETGGSSLSVSNASRLDKNMVPSPVRLEQPLHVTLINEKVKEEEKEEIQEWDTGDDETKEEQEQETKQQVDRQLQDVKHESIYVSDTILTSIPIMQSSSEQPEEEEEEEVVIPIVPPADSSQTIRDDAGVAVVAAIVDGGDSVESPTTVATAPQDTGTDTVATASIDASNATVSSSNTAPQETEDADDVEVANSDKNGGCVSSIESAVETSSRAEEYSTNAFSTSNIEDGTTQDGVVIAVVATGIAVVADGNNNDSNGNNVEQSKAANTSSNTEQATTTIEEETQTIGLHKETNTTISDTSEVPNTTSPDVVVDDDATTAPLSASVTGEKTDNVAMESTLQNTGESDNNPTPPVVQKRGLFDLFFSSSTKKIVEAASPVEIEMDGKVSSSNAAVSADTNNDVTNNKNSADGGAGVVGGTAGNEDVADSPLSKDEIHDVVSSSVEEKAVRLDAEPAPIADDAMEATIKTVASESPKHTVVVQKGGLFGRFFPSSSESHSDIAYVGDVQDYTDSTLPGDNDKMIITEATPTSAENVTTTSSVPLPAPVNRMDETNFVTLESESPKPTTTQGSLLDRFFSSSPTKKK